MTDESIFERDVFNIIFDALIASITRRFEALKEIQIRFSFLWQYLDLDESQIHLDSVNFCKYYKEDVCQDSLRKESLHLKAFHKDNLGNDSLPPLTLLNKIVQQRLEVLFPNIMIALRILCTLIVSAAERERSFSGLADNKNDMRSTMFQDRLNNLSTLALESALARKLNFNDLISNFANKKARKALLE